MLLDEIGLGPLAAALAAEVLAPLARLAMPDWTRAVEPAGLPRRSSEQVNFGT